jgi:hypothetical protein
VPDREPSSSTRDRLLHASGDLDAFLAELDRVGGGLPSRISMDPEELEQGLAHLVLTIIELVRQLMERQAVRRIEAGSLTDEEVERLGQTFLALQERVEELKRVFGLEDEELNLDLGPLGNLL